MIKGILKKLFVKQLDIKPEEKIEEKAKWHVTTHPFTKKMTKSIEIYEKKKNCLIVEQEDRFWAPFIMPVEKGYLHTLHQDLNELKEICVTKGHEFNISPLMNEYHKYRGRDMRRHVYIDPNREDKHVYDIDLFFNKKGRIDSFAVGTRPRLFAFAGEPPRVIAKTPLRDFHIAMDYLKEKI